MQRVTLVRYTTKPGQADTNEALSRAVFEELREAAPAHTAYALLRDGDSFLHLFVNTESETATQLVDLPAFQAFSKDINERCGNPPALERFAMRLLDAYGFSAP